MDITAIIAAVISALWGALLILARRDRAALDRDIARLSGEIQRLSDAIASLHSAISQLAIEHERRLSKLEAQIEVMRSEQSYGP